MLLYRRGMRFVTGVLIFAALLTGCGGSTPKEAAKAAPSATPSAAPEPAVTAAPKPTTAAPKPTTAAPAPRVTVKPVAVVPRTQAPSPAPVRTTRAPSTDPRYSTCKEAKAHGFGPYRRGVDPEYDWYTDRDKDGIVCE
jgi:hypothetical protein